jgi:hypothetical protein
VPVLAELAASAGGVVRVQTAVAAEEARVLLCFSGWMPRFARSKAVLTPCFGARLRECKTAKNRVHLDVHVPDDRKPAEVERLIGLGAHLVETRQDRGPLTYVLRDPEGNEFCVH